MILDTPNQIATDCQPAALAKTQGVDCRVGLCLLQSKPLVPDDLVEAFNKLRYLLGREDADGFSDTFVRKGAHLADLDP
ncbi:hypothetical protein Dform_02092 [Dehalogenimonas formicexedens]|uniref:Uncharacterized protein n=1 Tax=Dehalogenimonas formicexedens TaxID=1839801 RepID=A0A1P8FAC9_9CHLR|nr:hypothetical protein Dform_02092 [Dehalogenimonas formicexedens]